VHKLHGKMSKIDLLGLKYVYSAVARDAVMFLRFRTTCDFSFLCLVSRPVECSQSNQWGQRGVKPIQTMKKGLRERAPIDSDCHDGHFSTVD